MGGWISWLLLIVAVSSPEYTIHSDSLNVSGDSIIFWNVYLRHGRWTLSSDKGLYWRSGIIKLCGNFHAQSDSEEITADTAVYYMQDTEKKMVLTGHVLYKNVVDSFHVYGMHGVYYPERRSGKISCSVKFVNFRDSVILTADTLKFWYDTLKIAYRDVYYRSIPDTVELWVGDSLYIWGDSLSLGWGDIHISYTKLDCFAQTIEYNVRREILTLERDVLLCMERDTVMGGWARIILDGREIQEITVKQVRGKRYE